MELFFLGTGGGRFVTSLQLRSTAGFLIFSQKNVWVDPGPCSLLRARMAKIKPEKVDILLISHYHTDHFAGILPVIEAVSHATKKKRGVLIASQKVLEGGFGEIPAIPNYYKNLLSETTYLKAGEQWGDAFPIIATRTVHEGDPTGIGFKFPSLKLSYTGDTGFFEGLVEDHKGSELVIVNMISNEREVLKNVMSVGGCIEFLNGVNPKKAILTHFGIRVLREGPDRIGKEIEKETGIEIIVARDGMRYLFETGQSTLQMFG